MLFPQSSQQLSSGRPLVYHELLRLQLAFPNLPASMWRAEVTEAWFAHL